MKIKNKTYQNTEWNRNINDEINYWKWPFNGSSTIRSCCKLITVFGIHTCMKNCWKVCKCWNADWWNWWCLWAEKCWTQKNKTKTMMRRIKQDDECRCVKSLGSNWSMAMWLVLYTYRLWHCLIDKSATLVSDDVVLPSNH